MDTSSKSALRWGVQILWTDIADSLGEMRTKGEGQKSRKFCDVLNGSHIDFYPSLMETNTTIAGS